jgi:hypothetical protein
MTDRSIVLGARVAGDWTRALHNYASTEQVRIAVENDEKVDNVRHDDRTRRIEFAWAIRSYGE